MGGLFDQMFDDEEQNCIQSSDWWINEISHKISSHASGILFNYISYLEQFSPPLHVDNEEQSS